MTILEITLIIIGLILIFGSFMIKEKLSPNDIEKIAKISETELKVIVDRQLNNANSEIENMIDDQIYTQKEISKRELEKETNEKIIAINEYSDTVLDSINKSHNEIMFLYSMLNDKHKELTDFANKLDSITKTSKNINSIDLSRVSSNVAIDNRMIDADNTKKTQTDNRISGSSDIDNSVINNSATNKSVINNSFIGKTSLNNNGLATNSATANNSKANIFTNNTIKDSLYSKNESSDSNDFNNTRAKLYTNNAISSDDELEGSNHNNDIMMLHKSGASDVEIAKKLNLGLGEVRLVIDLYEDSEDEV